MLTLSEWKTTPLSQAIEEAISEPDPALANQKITLVHYHLSRALQEVLGAEIGANFHSWAVWGSIKAGVTIRQEDLDRAIQDARRVAGVVGLIVGLLLAYVIMDMVLSASSPFLLTGFLLLLGALLGASVGALTGQVIARYSRARAAGLILTGNRTVLEDIGGQTARFVEIFHNGRFTPEKWHRFETGMHQGPTETGGQTLLKRAFQQYAQAMKEPDVANGRRACYFANCLAILHEHIRLQPYIAKSLPWIIRRCVTKRMMAYHVGDLSLSVAEEFAAHHTKENTITLNAAQKRELREWLHRSDNISSLEDWLIRGVSATNWTSLKQRMRYIWQLFAYFHMDGRVFSEPWINQAWTKD